MGFSPVLLLKPNDESGFAHGVYLCSGLLEL